MRLLILNDGKQALIRNLIMVNDIFDPVDSQAGYWRKSLILVVSQPAELRLEDKENIEEKLILMQILMLHAILIM